MKWFLPILVVFVVSCKKEVITANSLVTNIVDTSSSTINKSNLNVYLLNIDSIRSTLGVLDKGMMNGTNNLGWVILDINNDGLMDIFYPYSSPNQNKMKPDVFINKGNYFILDNTMLPLNFNGSILTRHTSTADFNSDGLSDLILINSGWDQPPFIGEENILLLSNKVTGKYEIGTLPNIGNSMWHSGDVGDLNGDGKQDIFLLNAGQGAGGKNKILYGDGKGNFNPIDWISNVNTGGYLTVKITDVDKDRKQDIIIVGNEVGTPGSISLKSTIFFNSNNTFSNQVVICEPNTIGWGQVMDIICADIDGDGTNEIILDRTGDQSHFWYSGYNITFYKSTDDYKTFTDLTNRFIINNATPLAPQLDWMKKMILINSNNILLIKGLYGANGIKIWVQNPTTKIFY